MKILFTYADGSFCVCETHFDNSYAITSFANGGGTVVVTSLGHGLSNDDAITISGTTNYNGTYVVSNVTTNTFDIVEVWSGDDAAGRWTIAGPIYLNVGSVVSDTCTLDAYKINWHKDSISNPIEFTSGEGLAPGSVSYVHPIVNKPSEDGDWIPVLEYIIVGGITYYPKTGETENYCKLSTFNILKLYCSDTWPPSQTGAYTKYVEYDSLVDNPENADSTWTLYVTVSTVEISIRFYTKQEADKLIITYVSPLNGTETELARVMTGMNIIYSDGIVVDRHLASHQIHVFGDGTVARGASFVSHTDIYFSVDLRPFTWALGDYLKFEVDPGVMDRTVKNTNWYVWFECYDSVDAITIPNASNDITAAPSVSFNSSTCAWEFRFPTTSNVPLSSFINFYDEYTSNANACGSAYDPYACVALENKYDTGRAFMREGAYACDTASDIILFSRVLNQITITFLSSIDYYSWKANYDWVATHADYTDYVAIKEGSITAFADAGGGQVTVTSVGHGLSNGEWVTIEGTTNYNGQFYISNVATNTFEITDTWAGDDATGNWYSQDDANNENQYKFIRLEVRLDAAGIIFSFADAGGGEILCTCATDIYLINGDSITITYSTYYDGTYNVSDVDAVAKTFKITGAYVGTSGAYFKSNETNAACTGDDYIDLVWTVHYESFYSWVAPAGATPGYATIDLIDYDNRYLQINSCDYRFSKINSFVGLNNALYNLPLSEFPLATYATNDYPFLFVHYVWITVAETLVTSYRYFRVQKELADLSGWTFPAEWCPASIIKYPGDPNPTEFYYFYRWYLKVEITNMADPANNYKVWNQLDPVTGCPTGIWVLIYQKP